MGYTTPEYYTSGDRLRSRLLSDLTNDEELTDGVIDEVSLQNAIDDASAFIDLKLSGLYSVPITSPASALIILKKIESGIVLYYLFAGLLNTPVPPEINKLYGEAVALLEQIGSGILKLQATGNSNLAIGSNRSDDDIIYDATFKEYYL